MLLSLTKFTALLITGLLILPVVYAQTAKTNFKFDFGKGKADRGYTKVTPETIFNDNTGYGFDFDSKVAAVVNNDNRLTGDYITADKPFYFSVNVPEGNYKVTV